MEQYILKSVIMEEIKRYKHKADERLKIKGRTLSEDCKDSALQNLCGNLLHFIDTLEVKEVDLEKEYDNEFFKDPIFSKLVNRNAGISIAKHFFELGLKARTNKELIEEIYSHIDSIKNTADRMTSGNFMHNRAAIKFSANTIAKVLELMGLKAQKGEEV